MKSLAFIIGVSLVASPLAAQLRVDNNYKDLTQRSTQRDDRVKKRQQDAEAKKKAADEAKKKQEEEAKKAAQQRQQQAAQQGKPGTPGQQNQANGAKGQPGKPGSKTASKGYGSTEATGNEVTQVMLNAIKTKKVHFNPERAAENKSVILLNPYRGITDSTDDSNLVKPL